MKTFQISSYGIRREKRNLVLTLTFAYGLIWVLNLSRTLMRQPDAIDAISNFSYWNGQLISALIFQPIIFICFGALTFYFGARQRHVALESLQIHFSSEQVARTEAGKRDKQLLISQITEIEDMGETIVLWTQDKQQGLNIPKSLNGLQQIQEFFAARNVKFKSTVWQLRTQWAILFVGLLIWSIVMWFDFGSSAKIVATLGMAALLLFFYLRFRHYTVAALGFARFFLVMLAVTLFVGIGEFILSRG